MPKLTRSETNTLEEYGFEFSAPPAKNSSRKGKNHELWEAARELCEKYQGQSLKVLEYSTPSSAYNTAKAINNGDNKVFAHDYSDWKAVARNVGQVEGEDGELVDSPNYGVWLTYEPHDSEGE